VVTSTPHHAATSTLSRPRRITTTTLDTRRSAVGRIKHDSVIIKGREEDERLAPERTYPSVEALQLAHQGATRDVLDE